VGTGRGEIRLSSDLGPAPGESAKMHPVSARLATPRKPPSPQNLSRGLRCVPILGNLIL
jgi:hypothetical protein